MGVQRVELETPHLAQSFPKDVAVDAVLDLIGNSVLLDSIAIPRRGGRVCLAGFLGGLDPVSDFNPMLQMPSGRHLSFFGSFHFGSPGFPLSDVPLQEIAEAVAAGRYNAEPAEVFRFEKIEEAHRIMDEGRATGKLVVVMGDN